MKVGDYVRTKYGIRKVIQINNETTSKIICYVLDKFYNECKICSSNYVYDEDIIKSSPKIIDLIEVGDYVNGTKVTMVSGTRYDKNDLHCYCDYCQNKETGKWLMIPAKDIKSIVTREQFEAMQYKVGE